MAATHLRPVNTSISAAEWDTRCNLAALYRVLHKLGWTDLIFTHMSARVPGEDGHFLINNFGEMFDEVTASSLGKLDFDGNVMDDHDAEQVNNAGFVIHSAVYMARPDVNCVMHLHTPASVAVSVQKEGLLPISQHAMMVMGTAWPTTTTPLPQDIWKSVSAWDEIAPRAMRSCCAITAAWPWATVLPTRSSACTT